MPTYYDILGVPYDAGQPEIRQAFRRLARQLHPDVGGQVSSERFSELTEAYRTLIDPQRRRRYDETLFGQRVTVRREARPGRFPQALWVYRPPGPSSPSGSGHGGEIVFGGRSGRQGFSFVLWRLG